MNALYYVAGYVSFKCKKYPNCKYSFGGFGTGSNSYSVGAVSEWVCRISTGHLPSDVFWEHVQLMEGEFQAYFSEQNHSGISSLIQSVSKNHPNIPIQLIKTFIRTRLFFRIRFQNKNHAYKRNNKKLAKFLT